MRISVNNSETFLYISLRCLVKAKFAEILASPREPLSEKVFSSKIKSILLFHVVPYFCDTVGVPKKVLAFDQQ